MAWINSQTIWVPAQNSANNLTISDVVGNKTDTVAWNSVWALSDKINDHNHSSSKVYPTLANWVTVAWAAGAWALSAAWVEIVPANTIAAVFDIHYINAASVSADDSYELVLASGGAGSEVEVWRVRFTRSASSTNAQLIPFMTPLIAANSRISAKIASSTWNDSAVISLFYHIY